MQAVWSNALIPVGSVDTSPQGKTLQLYVGQRGTACHCHPHPGSIVR